MDRRKTGDVIFYALNLAIEERNGLIDAYSNDDSEKAVRDAKKDISAFLLLKKRLFGNRKSRKELFFEQPARVINIFEIRRFIEKNPELVITEDTDN